jgi:hypothetical protein
MRVRSLVLVVCMVVVPALAMFSHHVPPEVAAAIRQFVSGRQPPRSTKATPAIPSPASPTTAGQAADAPPSSPVAAAAATAAAPLPPATVPATMAVPASGRRAIEDRLLELGATAIECQPLPGGSGTLLASCRVAADASGQLQRLFQAVGPEPTVALETLRSEVEAWRRRTAARSPAVTR